jgi:hypothetical protein
MNFGHGFGEFLRQLYHVGFPSFKGLLDIFLEPRCADKASIPFWQLVELTVDKYELYATAAPS